MQGEGLDEKDIATRKIEGFVRLREAVHYPAGSGKFWQILLYGSSGGYGRHYSCMKTDLIDRLLPEFRRERMEIRFRGLRGNTCGRSPLYKLFSGRR